jgi:hypothetical protein
MAKSQIRQYVFTPGAATVAPFNGTIEIPGKYDLQQFLVITNTTKNVILYNFADSAFAGTQVSFTRAADIVNYPTALDNADGYTLMTLAVSTVGMSANDTIQIFYEQPFQYVRSPEIGTDAFERQRVAAPQSLLDADFEYGMQPTKWLTISQMRNYPATYEIPGTDLGVVSAVSDASSTTGGASTAESTITITTTVAHNYVVGQPFTIVGMNSAFTGYDRAEGTFIVFSIPTTTSFTYIAKGKVGFNAGDSIGTAFTQLRQAGFYSGANINAVINLTATATNSSGYLITLNSVTGLAVNSPITFQTVTTNCVATNTNGNITLGTTVGMIVGMPLAFSGVNFGGLVTGTTYYVLSVVDTRTVTVSLVASGPTFLPTSTVIGGNMYVVGGSNFGNIISGTQYYISSIVSNQITISTNITFNTTITATTALNNAVRFGTTVNMTVGEYISISGTTIGNLPAGFYYVYAILDSNYAQLSINSPTSLNGMSLLTQTTATGSMTATAGQSVPLTTATGYLWGVAVCPPTFTYTTPANATQFTGSTSGTVLTVGNVTFGTVAAGQGLLGGAGLVPSGTGIIAQLTPTGASAAASPSVTLGGAAGTFTFTVSTATNIQVGQILTGTGVGVTTFVQAINGSVITLTKAFTTAATGTYNFYASGGLGTYSISTTSTLSGTFYAVTASPVITVNTTSPHGFIPGQTINMLVSSENGFNNNTLANGPFFVETTPSSTQLTYTARAPGVITGTVSATLYARPDSFYVHRPFDGGVQLGTGLPAYGAQAIRMSKKYIRYQSGKSINFNTGLLMAPNYFVRSAVATGTTYVTNLNITNITTGGVATITSGTYTQGQAIIVNSLTLNGAIGFTAGTYYSCTSTTGTTITLASSYANATAATPVPITTVTTTGAISASSVTAAQVITIITDDVDHGCQVGATVNLNGIITSGYNGNYTVSSIVDERTVQVISQQTLGASGSITGAVVTDPALLSLISWYGAVVRSGTYDDQNGVFWQYDGSVVAVVKRSATFQLGGTISLNVGSGQVIGTNTRFTSQLFVGDRVVIRGMTHHITQVVSDTQLYVNPQWRGAVNVAGIKFTKVIDYVIPQSRWNLDRCDGSNGPFNPSGYQINPIKMQMVAVQWTWYGAGFIDWMLRGPDGKYITVHRLRNNNLNNEAWMRTGNMPVRYEVLNEGARSYVVGSVNVSTTDTVIPVNDVSLFPTPVAASACTVFVDNELITYTGKVYAYVVSTQASGNTVTMNNTTNMAVGQPIVFINPGNYNNMGNIVLGTTYYVASVSGVNIQISTTSSNPAGNVFTQVNYTQFPINGYAYANSLIGCLRAQTINPWATGGYRSFSAGAAATHAPQTGVILVNSSASPVVSHWGAAFIEDGGFDSDRSYIFNYQVTNVNISTKKNTAFAIRLAPSVSNALPGDLGNRELINRASFLLQSLESSSGTGGTNAAIVVEAVLNPSNYPALANIQFNSLSSAVNPTGQPSFSQVAPGTSMIFSNSVNNYFTVPVYVQAGSITIPLNTNPAGTVNIADDVYFPTSTASLYGLTKVAGLLATSGALTCTISNTTVASFTANFAGNVMTVTAVASGTLTVGMLLTGTSLGSGTYITNNITGTGSGVGNWTVSVTQTIGNVTVTGTAVIMTVVAAPGNIPVGCLLAGGSVAANTYVIAYGTGTGGTGTYYLSTSQNGTNATTNIFYGLTLTQATLNPVTLYTASGTTINCSRSTYALPGETVFSFINSPANKDGLDLSNLKELTNTPIGGRGCFPNGCDVMFVNVYITQGAPISTNIVLRWGEAQA